MLDFSMPRVIGMVHLKPLPGSPGYAGDLEAIRAEALRDAAALSEGGVDAIMIENFGDVPFFKDDVPKHTVATMTMLAAAVRGAVDVPIGINCLRNDGCAAMAIAAAVGAAFIRVNILTAARVTDQGIIEGCAAKLLRLRKELGAGSIAVWADVDVKHSAPLAPMPLEQEVHDLVDRGGAGAVIVSGTGTGQPTDPQMAKRVRAIAPGTPVLVGSGIDERSIDTFRGVASGFIVGTAFKRDGRVDQPVDPDRVRRLVERVRGWR